MPSVISVRNLGKRYLLQHGGKQHSYVALRDVLSEGVKKLGRGVLGRGTAAGAGAGSDEFWALQDISFEVEKGERIGIIGRNGAGKSTLLKILSRITEPTTGTIRMRGRVASLLEVGTGFHPELTGRENIYLNGAILGMHRAEIRKKFDEIVDFAEIEKFLEIPVKRYSSGMYVRLAFAVAAHLEQEILVVDEVLAVGDAQFQKKCLGKMEDVSVREGRTVFFVSHNMAAIQALCDRGILLKNGRLAEQGKINDVTTLYWKGLEPEASDEDVVISSADAQWTAGRARICDGSGNRLVKAQSGSPLSLEVEVEAAQGGSEVAVLLGLDTAFGSRISLMSSDSSGKRFKMRRGRQVISCDLAELPLCPGSYSVSLELVGAHGTILYHPRILSFDVQPGIVWGISNYHRESWAGNFLLQHTWQQQ